MLRLRGGSALSSFRRDRLLTHLPGVRELSASHWHFVALSRELTPDERRRLGELLEEQPEAAASASADPRLEQQVEQIIVAPRIGTVSPWASKATDIAHNCGLAA